MQLLHATAACAACTRRCAFHVQAAIRERTQAVERLATAEAESGQLHLELAATLATAEENEARMSVRAAYWLMRAARDSS